MKEIKVPQHMIDKCNDIIDISVSATNAINGGLLLPTVVDSTIVTHIQVRMVICIGKIFELNITETMANSIIASLGISFVGRTISGITTGWIPLVGKAMNTEIDATLTKSIGNLAIDKFSRRWIKDRQKGYNFGRKDGYNEASSKYEQKLRDLSDDFNDQKEKYKNEMKKYENILREYEAYIKTLENNNCDEEYIDSTKDKHYVLKKVSDK